MSVGPSYFGPVGFVHFQLARSLLLLLLVVVMGLLVVLFFALLNCYLLFTLWGVVKKKLAKTTKGYFVCKQLLLLFILI